MPCPSWGLEARTKCVVSCPYCYAAKGRYTFPNVKAAMAYRDADWQTDTWVDRMVEALRGQTIFRWFDSGDLYCQALIDKIVEVCRRTPQVLHRIPTKAYLKPSLDIDILDALPNVVLRYSIWRINDTRSFEDRVRAVVVSSPTGEGFPCPATISRHVCGDCRACWDKSIYLVEYVKH